MGPQMYRHRPAYPALIGAVTVMFFGALATFHFYKMAESGETDKQLFLMSGMITLAFSGALLIAAFARYQFTHLWQRPDPAFSKKERKRRRECRSI